MLLSGSPLANGSHYHLAQNRGVTRMLEGTILNKPVNVPVHDCLSSCWNQALSVVWHAVCNAHIIRELTHGEKRDPEAAWALLMRDLLLRANEACTTARSRNKAKFTAVQAEGHQKEV